MKRIKQWLRGYFGFSQRETNGFLFLFLVMVLAAAAPFILRKMGQPAAYNPIKDQVALDSLAALLDRAAPPESYAGKANPKSLSNRPVRLHKFNPNTATQTELTQLGISRYAASNIIKYRAKAGDFRYKEQLKRIYGLPEVLYQQLYPYIDLPPQADKRDNFNRPNLPDNPDYDDRSTFKPERKIYRLQPFDINTADTTQLKMIRGNWYKIIGSHCKLPG